MLAFMKRRLLFLLIVLGLVLLALCAWAVDGLRWTLGGWARPRVATV
jgi:hypothetical protein